MMEEEEEHFCHDVDDFDEFVSTLVFEGSLLDTYTSEQPSRGSRKGKA